MCEKVALELSELGTKEEFIAEAADGGLNFAILCNVRILVEKKTRDQSEETISAVIVEAQP